MTVPPVMVDVRGERVSVLAASLAVATAGAGSAVTTGLFSPAGTGRVSV